MTKTKEKTTKEKKMKTQEDTKSNKSRTSMTSGFELNASIRQYLNVTDSGGVVGLITSLCKGNPLTVRGKGMH